MAKAAGIGSTVAALVSVFRPDAAEFGVLVGLIALWLVPNWLYKLLELAEAWRRYRRDEASTNKRS